MNGLNVLGFSSTGFDWWLDNNVPAQSLQHESSSWLRGFGVAHFHLCLHSPSCPPSLCVQHVEGNQNCVVFSYLKLQWHKTVQTQPALTFFFFLSICGQEASQFIRRHLFCSWISRVELWSPPLCGRAASCRVLKVEIADPVHDVEQQEGGGEKDARVRVQFK